ncbi:MAG: DUF192 domain-containing protein [bacterium]|jgi:uncharacterized membrane protein (UPF0127 family)|nr:DUF192 domain-containing protein [bacterium]
MACQQQPTAPGEEGRLGPLRTLQFELGGVPVEIEVALRMDEQTQGLMYRESMPENHGMLFVYPQPRYMSFWMKNTRIPLAIAFIREDGVISNIEEMEPYTGLFDPDVSYRSKYQCLYALEMNQGWFAKHGIKEGDRIALPVEQIEALKTH